MTKRLIRAVALMAVLALVLMACGTPGGDETTTTAASSTTAAPATTATTAAGDTTTTEAMVECTEPIKIGLLQPLTGGLAASGGDAKAGFELYWETNGQTAGGCDIEYQVVDTAGNPDTALQLVDQLVDSFGADIIVGELLANVTLALADRLKDKDVIFMSPIGSADDLTQRVAATYPNFTRAGGWTSSQTSHVLGDWAYEQGYRTAATMCTDYAFGHEMCGGFTQVFTEAGGTIDPAQQLWNPLGSTDLGSYVTQLQGFAPDVVFNNQVGASVSDFYKNWSDFGLKDEIPMLGGETMMDVSNIRNVPPDQVVGLISSGHWAEGLDAPATQEFVEIFDAAVGQIPSYYAAATWTAAQDISATVEAMNGDISDRAAALTAMKGLELDTPFGPSRLDDYGNPINDIYIRQVELREDGRLWNVVIDTYEDIDQFWPKTAEEYLTQPVYSRDFQGNAGG
ncbi:MAG: ABC transporter substrate-binding protein [Acidimicrobiia bacterium]